MDLVTSCNVIDNTMLLLPSGFSTTSYRGIHVQAPGTTPQTLFWVIDNNINYTGTSVTTVGITVDNCKGLSNYVFRNTLYNCKPGIQLLNRNRAAVSSDGLGGVHFECNTFHQCSKDIAISCSGSGCSSLSTGVAGTQANTFGNPGPSFNYSALNNFTNSINTAQRDDIDAGVDPAIGTINGFRYRYRQQDFNISNYNLGTNQPLECSLITDPAPYNLVTPQLQLQNPINTYCSDLIIGLIELPLIQSNNQSAESSRDNLKQIYTNLVDGGNTETLKSNVLFANYSQALALYESLMNESPALSDDVMLAAINKEYELPASLLTIILAANPSAAKNPEIWKAINERSVPLDAYQRAQIMLGYYSTSPKEILEDELGNYQAGIDQSLQQALTYFTANSSSSAMQSLREMFATSASYENELLLAELEIQCGNYLAGQTLLQNLITKHKLASAYESSLLNQNEIRRIQHEAVNRTGHQLETSELDFLLDLRNNDACDLGPLAQTLLIAFAGFEEQELMCATTKKLTTNIEKEPKHVTMNAYPNPTNIGWVVIKLSHPLLGAANIQLYDATSRIVKREIMKEPQQELFMDISDLSAGVYWLRNDLDPNETIQIIIQ